MTANELRIGNCISYDNRIFQIHTIADEYPTLNTIEFGIGVVDWNNIKPVNLNEEWYSKFDWGGFKQGYFNSYFYLDDRGCLYYCGDFTGIVCKTVHHAQNLKFALTGEELTIKE